MELKEYPCVLVEKSSDGSGNGIDPYHEDTQTCCLFQLCCFIPRKRRKDIQEDDCRTTVKGLDDDLVHENILVDLTKECRCKGKIVEDGKLGRMIQLEGNQESQVKEFLHRQGLIKA